MSRSRHAIAALDVERVGRSTYFGVILATLCGFRIPECGLGYLTAWLPFSAVDILNSFIQFYTESRNVIIAKEIAYDFYYVKKSFDADSCS